MWKEGNQKHPNICGFIFTFYLQPDAVVMTISASDFDDGNNSLVEYEILRERDFQYFKIDKESGIIYLKRPIDKRPGQSYAIIVRAYNVVPDPPQDAQIEVRIRVVESSIKPPSFVNPIDTPIYLKENLKNFTHPIATLRAVSNMPDKPEVIFELNTGRTEQTNSKNTFVFNQIGNEVTIAGDRFLCSLGHGKWKTVGPLCRLCPLLFRLHLLVLLRLQFLANAVRDDFAPVDLGPGDGQLATHCLECRVRHRLIVLRNGQLVLILGVLDQTDHLLGHLLLVADHHAFAALLRGNQLDVAVLVVVHLHLEHTLQFGGSAARLEGHMPLGAPSAIPIVLRLELVVFDANGQGDLVALRLSKN